MKANDFIFGGSCSFQYGGYEAQLNHVDIRLYNLEGWSAKDFVFWHTYDPSIFDDSQISHLMSGGVIRHTFGYRNDGYGGIVEVDRYTII